MLQVSANSVCSKFDVYFPTKKYTKIKKEKEESVYLISNKHVNLTVKNISNFWMQQKSWWEIFLLLKLKFIQTIKFLNYFNSRNTKVYEFLKSTFNRKGKKQFCLFMSSIAVTSQNSRNAWNTGLDFSSYTHWIKTSL